MYVYICSKIRKFILPIVDACAIIYHLHRPPLVMQIQSSITTYSALVVMAPESVFKTSTIAKILSSALVTPA